MFVSHVSNSCHSHACIFAFRYKSTNLTIFLVFTGLIILLMGNGNIISFANIKKIDYLTRFEKIRNLFPAQLSNEISRK